MNTYGKIYKKFKVVHDCIYLFTGYVTHSVPVLAAHNTTTVVIIK